MCARESSKLNKSEMRLSKLILHRKSVPDYICQFSKNQYVFSGCLKARLLGPCLYKKRQLV